MKPTKILIGAPLEGDEAHFLHTLHRDLKDSGALILANFSAKQKNGPRRQIDFVVITATHAAVLELKNFPRPIFGHENGVWEYLNSAGKRVCEDDKENPYVQTLQQKYALSDEMKRHKKKNPDVPAPLGRSFYADFAGFVCIYPEIHPESLVTRGDHKVVVRSYPHIIETLLTPSKPSTWSLADWRHFAEKHLKLTEVTVLEATDPKIAAASEKIRTYRTRLESIVGSQLPPLLAGSEDPDYGQGLINSALQPRNFLLVGPSGSAKTFHLHHLAFTISTKGEEVPLLVEAKKYRGSDFWSVLRYGTVPFFPGDPKELLEAIRLCGRRPLLMIDALNECPATYLSDLIRGVQAFVLRFKARIILTSQDTIELPADLQAITKRLALPDTSQKRQIYSYHAGIAATPDVDEFCAGFTNAYDVSIAGRCHTQGVRPESPTTLYDRYVRQCLPERPNVAAALLRKVAGEMGKTLSTVWSRDVFERTAEQFLADQHISLGLLDDLEQCRLTELTDDFFSFEHELLFKYFKAEDLRRNVNNVEELATQLKKPRNHELLDFLVPRFSDPSDIATLLSTTDDVSFLCSVLSGKCGSPAQSVLLNQCEQVLEAAAQDLPNIEISIEIVQAENGRRCFVGLDAKGYRLWSHYEKLLCIVIALNLDHPKLQQRFMKLLDETEWSLRTTVRSAAKSAGFKPDPIWGEAVRAFGGIGSYAQMRLPCEQILSSLRLALMPFTTPRPYAKDLPIRQYLLERTRRTPESHFALLALFEDYRHATDHEDIPTNLKLVQQGWNSGIYILRIHALDLLQSMGQAVEETCPQELPRIREMLEGFETDNIVENSTRLETLALYDGLEPPVSLEHAISQMRSVIAPNAADDPTVVELAQLSGISSSEFLAEQAYGYLSNIFEEIFQEVYGEAYWRLSEEEKRDILCLAAMSRDPSFHATWILRELAKYGGKQALPVYQHFAAGIDEKSCLPQDAVATFVGAIEGCAQWSDEPPRYLKGDSPEHQAWETIGEILFWVCRGTAINGSRHKIEELWARVTGPIALAAGDVLYQLSHSGCYRLNEETPAPNLTALFAREVQPIVEYCINNRDSISSVFSYGGSRDRAVIRYLIELLGKIGDETSIPTLQEIVDDHEFGKDAIFAIKLIQKAALGERASPSSG